MVLPASFLAQYQDLVSKGNSEEEIERFVLGSLIEKNTRQFSDAATKYSTALTAGTKRRDGEGDTLLLEAEKAPDITDAALKVIAAHVNTVDDLEEQRKKLESSAISTDTETDPARSSDVPNCKILP